MWIIMIMIIIIMLRVIIKIWVNRELIIILMSIISLKIIRQINKIYWINKITRKDIFYHLKTKL
jgi:hypothetical protein